MLLQQQRRTHCRPVALRELRLRSVQEAVRVERRVGQGSFGEVFAAVTPEQCRVALKKIRPAENNSVPASFLKELFIQQAV